MIDTALTVRRGGLVADNNVFGWHMCNATVPMELPPTEEEVRGLDHSHRGGSSSVEFTCRSRWRSRVSGHMFRTRLL